jgi:outer membrane protein assembly factor BamB
MERAMARLEVEDLLFIGVKGHALALDRRTGAEVWRTTLTGRDMVLLHRDGERLYASTKGELFCLDPRSGTIHWHNALKGLGLGLVSVATDAWNDRGAADHAAAREIIRQRQHAAAGGGS